ncbi:OmpH family outer membrane protein [Candidatus Trichorickettsia mobilis]|uniref:OmpH family outer membrane protein n=1 Tax=Candidatus Trichorickettsia mobilis TaxID=1346319 RepID=A0ABZ0UR86_9RICK|nr:OmpH family outer membrane protein [Candidatus Trichorickettsia mobilis]WPY00560.1 OmpH family outer membrane protein [Candidatus Trichorickettsia mobilis]
MSYKKKITTKYWQLFTLLSILFINQPNLSIGVEHKFNTKIAVVDVQSILEHSVAMQNIRKSIDVISSKMQQDVTQKEIELKRIEEELIKKRSILNEEAFEKVVSDFNQKVSAAQKDMQNKKTRLEQAHAEAIRKVHDATITVISDLAKKYNFNLVLPSSQVLFVTNELNITHEVVELLNNKIKTIKVNF